MTLADLFRSLAVQDAAYIRNNEDDALGQDAIYFRKPKFVRDGLAGRRCPALESDSAPA